MEIKWYSVFLKSANICKVNIDIIWTLKGLQPYETPEYYCLI